MDQDYDNFTEHASNRQLIPPSSPDISYIVGAPQLNPRLGHEYQVEVPSMIKESERLQLLMNPANSPLVHDKSHCFVLGLPIPLMRVHDEVEDSRHEEWRYLGGENDGTINGTVPAAAAGVKKDGLLELDKGKEPSKSKNYLMTPGALSNSWSDADVKSFILGLFIFGKNFVQIKRFLENKGMGEILSFYYGKFYKSDEYRRWSECKKIKGRKCTTRHKLFTGWKQHELLSRLIPHVSEEFQDTLLKVSRSYVKGRTSLEEYISSLKSAVGLDALVEAVGIGKGKEDLTSLVKERGKKNRVFPIPTSKSWSSLGPSDIVRYLTGGIQLSKAKSNDLFWEAVWPRLLARGWHSEQLKNQGYTSSKVFLVFLIPGVKKFSRRELVKGDHYFDSISDVLSKVVADPDLLELEDEEAKVGGCNDEEVEKGSNEGGQSDYHHHCYLKPRASTNNVDHMKYTVIDTSLAHGRESSDIRKLKYLPGDSVDKIEIDAAGITYKQDKHLSKANHSKGKFDSINQKLAEFTAVDTSTLYGGKLSKLRELRYPPVELEKTSKMTGIAKESDRSSSDDNFPSETEAATLIQSKRSISNADFQKDTHNKYATSKKEASCNPDHNENKLSRNHEKQKTCVSDGNQLKRTLKHQFSRRTRSGHSNISVSPIKRRRLTACAKAETSRVQDNSSGGLRSENLGLSQSSIPDANNNASDPASHQQDVSLVSSSGEGSVKQNDEGSILHRVCLDKGISCDKTEKGSILNRVCLDKGISCDKTEKCESQLPINLNAPQVPLKSEDVEMVAMVEEEDEQGLKSNDIIPRRKSTRNRPLTVKALESLENEFLHVQKRQKREDTQTLKHLFSTCRRAHTRVKTMLHGHISGHGTPVSIEEKNLNGRCRVNENINKPLDYIKE